MGASKLPIINHLCKTSKLTENGLHELSIMHKICVDMLSVNIMFYNNNMLYSLQKCTHSSYGKSTKLQKYSYLEK